MSGDTEESNNTSVVVDNPESSEISQPETQHDETSIEEPLANNSSDQLAEEPLANNSTEQLTEESPENNNVEQLAEVQDSIPEQPQVEVQQNEVSDNELVSTEQETNEIQQVSNLLDELSIEQNSSECYFDKLTSEIIIYIFSMLPVNDLLNIQTVCKKWFEYGRSDAIWNMLYEETEWSIPFTPEYEVKTWYEVYQMRSRYEIEQIDMDYYVEEENQPDPFDGLLARDQITPEKLVELLGMEEFVNALQNGEESVLNYLEDTRTVRAMLELLMTHPEIPEDDMYLCRIYHIAFQTLISGIIADVFVQNYSLVEALFEYLDTIDFKQVPSKSPYISKIISSLFEKYPNEMITFFQARETFIPSLLLNAQDSHLMELLYKFVDCDITHQWLFEADLITRLVALLHQDESFETQENAAAVLVSILTIFQSWGHSVLVADILNNEVITGSVVAYIQSTPLNGNVIQLGIKVLIAILNLISDDLVDVPAVVSILTSNIGFFAKIMQQPDQLGESLPMRTSTGEIKRGFGFVRLGTLELLVSLLYTGFPVVVEGLVTENVFSVILDLLFEYPWNNIAHHQIVQMFSGLFCGNDELLIKSVLEKCKLVDRIAEAHNSAPASSGYLGHLRELANELLKLTKHSSQVATILGENDLWIEFVTGKLQDFNQIEGSMVRNSMGISDDELGNYENEYYDQAYDEYEVVDEDTYEYVLEGDFDDAEGTGEYEELEEDSFLNRSLIG